MKSYVVIEEGMFFGNKVSQHIFEQRRFMPGACHCNHLALCRVMRKG